MKTTFSKISKEAIGRELQWLLDQDRVIQGDYGNTNDGDDFKGCMMGCAVNSIMRINGDVIRRDDHSAQAEYIFGDESCSWFVKLYEKIFESLNIKDSKKWVIDCFKAIPDGVAYLKINDLEVPIKIWILESTKGTHNNKEVSKATNLVIDALKSGSKEDLEKARKAAAAAAAYAAYAAAAYVAAAAAAYAAYVAYAAPARDKFYTDLSIFVISKLEEINAMKEVK